MKDTYEVYQIIGPKKFENKELELKHPQGSQVLVKVKYCAICTLEQRIFNGILKMYPFAGGHEVAGEIVEVGDSVKTFKVGQSVALRMLASCGECYYCRNGHENQCVISYKVSSHEGLMGPGGFSQYMCVDSTAVYPVSDEIDLKYAALTEPLACCVHSINNGQIALGDDVVVVGNGIMGALHIQLAKKRGARVIVCEVDEGRLKFAKDLGADVLINSKKEDTIARVKELTQGRGADVVFCTAAISKLAEDSIKMTGKTGRVVMYSSFHPDTPIEIRPSKVHSSEIIITGSVNPDKKDFQTATRLLSQNLIDVSKLISKVYPLDKIEEGFIEAIKPETYRIILENK
jgi:L-iditol 2-dehydrogenase